MKPSWLLYAMVAAYAAATPLRAQIQLSSAARNITLGTKARPVYEQRLLVVVTAKVLVDRRPFYSDMTSQEYADAVRVSQVVLDQISQLAQAIGWQEYSDVLAKEWDATHTFVSLSSTKQTRDAARAEVLRLDMRRHALDEAAMKAADAAHFPHPNIIFEQQAKAVMHDIESAAELYVREHPVAPVQRHGLSKH